MGKGRFFQLQLAFATSFGQVVMSLLSVWPSYTCSILESDATPLSAPMTKSEESLLGSLPSLGAMLGTALVGTLIDRLGRKNGGIVLSLPFMISWVMIATTKSINVVLTARFLGGIAGGGFLVYAPIFISEVAEDTFRGTLASEPETKVELKADEAEKEKLNSENVEPEDRQKISSVKLLFMSPSSLRAFLVVLTVITMQVFMGIVPVQVYAKTVFTETDPTRSDLYTVIFALVLMCGSMLSTAAADKAGRRILIISSSILVSLCMASLGYLLQTRSAPAWVTVLCLMMYCFTYMFGAATVPYVLLTEVFISEVRLCHQFVGVFLEIANINGKT